MKKKIGEESDFGAGLVYCLFLFAKHWMFNRELLKSYKEDMYPEDEEKAISRWIDTWANGASDHFYDIQDGEGILPAELSKRIVKLQERALEIGHGFTGDTYTVKDFDWLFEEAENICMEIDKHLGIGIVKATWN